MPMTEMENYVTTSRASRPIRVKTVPDLEDQCALGTVHMLAAAGNKTRMKSETETHRSLERENLLCTHVNKIYNQCTADMLIAVKKWQMRKHD